MSRWDRLSDEHMIENVLDLRDRALKPGGRILPSKFELFIEPIKLTDHYRVPYLWEMRIRDLDFSCTRELAPSQRRQRIRSVLPAHVDYFLAEPDAVMAFDLETLAANEIPREVKYSKRVTRDGRLDGFAIYFNVIFDEEIRFTTNPLSSNPPGPVTSWNHLILAVEAREYIRGDVIHFTLSMGNPAQRSSYQWSYR